MRVRFPHKAPIRSIDAKKHGSNNSNYTYRNNTVMKDEHFNMLMKKLDNVTLGIHGHDLSKDQINTMKSGLDKLIKMANSAHMQTWSKNIKNNTANTRTPA